MRFLGGARRHGNSTRTWLAGKKKSLHVSLSSLQSNTFNFAIVILTKKPCLFSIELQNERMMGKGGREQKDNGGGGKKREMKMNGVIVGKKKFWRKRKVDMIVLLPPPDGVDRDGGDRNRGWVSAPRPQLDPATSHNHPCCRLLLFTGPSPNYPGIPESPQIRATCSQKLSRRRVVFGMPM